MPEDPSTGLLTRWVLENPYPLGFIGIVAGICLLWMSRFGGRGNHRFVGVVALLSAAAILLIGALVETSGEQAEALTEQLVDDAVNGNVTAVLSQFAPGAGFALGSPKNRPFAADVVGEQVQSINRRYSIDSNRITRLRAYTVSGDEAVVHLSCSTDTGGGYATPTSWIIEYKQQDDGELKIVRLTWMTVGMNKPSLGMFR